MWFVLILSVATAHGYRLWKIARYLRLVTSYSLAPLERPNDERGERGNTVSLTSVLYSWFVLR